MTTPIRRSTPETARVARRGRGALAIRSLDTLVSFLRCKLAQAVAFAQVPDRLEVVRAERIQNLQNWAEFRLKQQEILEELVQLKEREQLGACSNGHALIPLGTTQDNGWACDARNEGEGGCLSGITGFHQTKGKNRFRCEKCDFDYCDKCYLLRTGAKLCMKGHPLVPLGTTQDNGWGCDNASTKAGCLRQNKTKGVDRHRFGLSW